MPENRTMMHYHYIDAPDSPHRSVIEMDPSNMPGMPYGAIEWVYDPESTDADFISNRLEEIQPFVRNGILVMQGVFDPGTVITVALRKDHVLEDVVLDKVHSLHELANENGMLYWILVGRTGAFDLKAHVESDTEGRIAKIRSILQDLDVRDYLTNELRIEHQAPPVREEDYPPVMDLEMAARYLSISESTLYKIDKMLLPRTAQGRFRKSDLDAYLEKTMRRR